MPIVLLVLLSPALGFPGCDVGIESEQQGTSSCYDEAVWLQVPRGSHEEKPAERWGDSFVWLARPGGYKDWLSKLREKGSANVVSLLQRDQQGLQVFVMSLVGLMSLACFGMITFMVNTVISHVDGPSESRSGTPQSRLAAVAQSGALPSFCPQHMGHHNEPLRVELAAIEVQANWTLEIRHPNSKKAVFRAKMQRGGQNVEGVLARRRSFVQLFSSEITGEHLLGSVTSLHEIFFRSGVKFGQLFQREDSHLLYYDGGLPSRWSVGLEDAGLLSVVWLPMPGQGGRSGSKSTFREMINDGMEKLGGRHHAHSRHGRTVATMELQLTEDRGARLDIVTLSGTDSVLVVLCTLGLIAFDGIFNLVDSQQFLEERTGLGWVSVMHAGKTAGPLSPHSSRLSPHGAPKAFPRQQKDAAHWAKLADMLDTNNSGTLSFLELARGLRSTGQSPRPTEVQGFDEVLGHREALLRACRALDADGCGRLPAEVFASILATAAPLAPAPEGAGAVAYAEILSSFEVVLDPDLVKAAARG